MDIKLASMVLGFKYLFIETDSDQNLFLYLAQIILAVVNTC